MDITGAMSFTPDTNGQSYFGTITQPETFSGILHRTTIKPHRGGCGGSRVPTTCPTGQGLEYAAPEGLSGFVGFAAVAETDPTTSTTTGLFGAERFRFGPRRFVAHVLLIRTPDTSWLTVQSDLSAGHVDTEAFNKSDVAVSLGDDGLIVPVIQQAHELSVEGLAARVKDLARRARARELTPDEVRGGTFTITNPGQYGSIMATPIINLPQVGILDFEAVIKRPVVVTDADGNDSIAIRPMTILGLSWDHRALDGALSAQDRPIMGRLIRGSSLGALRALVGA